MLYHVDIHTYQIASGLLQSCRMASHASNSWSDMPNQVHPEGGVDRFDDGLSRIKVTYRLVMAQHLDSIDARVEQHHCSPHSSLDASWVEVKTV
jgi:hypothetical protein